MKACVCGRKRAYGSGSKFCDVCMHKKERVYVSGLLGKYGLSSEDYYSLLSIQGNTCYVCLRRPGKRRLAVDHCHKTGKVRGLLCSRCNVYLGHIKDDVDAAMRLVDYLKRAR